MCGWLAVGKRLSESLHKKPVNCNLFLVYNSYNIGKYPLINYRGELIRIYQVNLKIKKITLLYFDRNETSNSYVFKSGFSLRSLQLPRVNDIAPWVSFISEPSIIPRLIVSCIAKASSWFRV